MESDGVTIGFNGNPEDLLENGAVDYARRLELLLASLRKPGAELPLLTSLAVLEVRYTEAVGGGAKHAPCALRNPASAISASLRLTSDITDAMHADRLLFSFWPIRAVHDSGRELYHACTVRVPLAGSPYVLSRPSFMPSLERVGGERKFDQFVVKRLIERLRMNPAVDLGYTISATSATPDASWSSIFEALAADANIASRLVIEIDEGTLVTAERAWSFATSCVSSVADWPSITSRCSSSPVLRPNSLARTSSRSIPCCCSAHAMERVAA
ncbi:EAL domain-containing protein [Burkholderia ubonensis]|uniref:EAL domain-containing protein n=1 Tax=Burkholderia ubonensis TaxID=101571 RepID=UPI0018E0220F|nr:EAL domain-containing protein [Burkholderia ubonensis]